MKKINPVTGIFFFLRTFVTVLILLAVAFLILAVSSLSSATPARANAVQTVNIVFAGQSNMTKMTMVQFGIVVSEVLNQDIKVRKIFCGVGGTGMYEWQRGNPIYDKCIGKIRDAGLIGEIDGLVFSQGEKDAKDSFYAEQWAENFETFVASFREDSKSDAPVVYSQLHGAFPDGFEAWGEVQQQQSLAQNVVENSKMISMMDFSPLEPRHVHYRAKGKLTMGIRLANAWYELSYP